jgi:hypothetical protein
VLPKLPRLGLLAQNVPLARQILRKVLEGRLVSVSRHQNEEHWYEFTGEGSLTKFFGAVAPPNTVASLMPARWNQIASWLKQIDNLHQAA